MIIAADRDFARKHRLTTPDEYKCVFRRARKIHNKCLTLLIRENNRGYPRLGLAISRKYTNSAVQRNMIKRLIREAFRRYKKELGAHDLVFVARPALSGKTRRELHIAVNELYMKIE